MTATSADAEAPPPGAHEPSGLRRVTLRQAIDQALARSTDILVARQEMDRAEALVRQARATSLPSLNANGSYTRLDADRERNGLLVASANQLNANLLLTVPIIAPQRWAQWSTASANAEARKATAEDQKRQTAVAVARAYLTVIAQRRVISVNERAIKNAKAHYDYAHTRLVGGVGNRVDDVRAAQEVAAVEAQVQNSYAAFSRATEGLGVLLGDQGPVDAVDEIDLAAPPELSSALVSATTTRRDVVAARSRLDAAETTRKNSYADYLPFLVGTFLPFYQNPSTFTQPTTGWQAQLLLTVPIYDGGLRYGLSDERDNLSAEARAQYDGLLRQARSDVRVAFEAVKRAEAALEAQTSAARLANEALGLATLAYKAGATTNIEVIDAERRARDAETGAAVAEDAARQARVDLLAASGRFP
ncbi:MAG TPA: TolC family protein [Polyangiaceae bacterium]|nr:TolC family protein [Polyangiaceae bacterium]